MNAWYVVAIVFITTSINLLIVASILRYEVKQKLNRKNVEWISDYEGTL
jgi:hypothetical protein